MARRGKRKIRNFQFKSKEQSDISKLENLIGKVSLNDFLEASKVDKCDTDAIKVILEKELCRVKVAEQAFIEHKTPKYCFEERVEVNSSVRSLIKRFIGFRGLRSCENAVGLKRGILQRALDSSFPNTHLPSDIVYMICQVSKREPQNQKFTRMYSSSALVKLINHYIEKVEKDTSQDFVELLMISRRIGLSYEYFRDIMSGDPTRVLTSEGAFNSAVSLCQSIGLNVDAILGPSKDNKISCTFYTFNRNYYIGFVTDNEDATDDVVQLIKSDRGEHCGFSLDVTSRKIDNNYFFVLKLANKQFLRSSEDLMRDNGYEISYKSTCQILSDPIDTILKHLLYNYTKQTEN